MIAEEPFNKHVASWISALTTNRNEHPMRDYLTKLLDAAIRGAQTQVELNEHYAKIKREGAASPLREQLEEFDFEAESGVWKERKAAYEKALKDISLP